MSDLIADIAVPVSVSKTFHYIVPENIRDKVGTGSRVIVPFGSRRLIGTILGFTQNPHSSVLKPVIEVLEDTVSSDLLSLAMWMSDYYIHPIGQTIDAMIPRAVARARPKKSRYVRLKSDPRNVAVPKGRRQEELVRILSERPETPIEELRGFSPFTIKALFSAGVIEIIERADSIMTAVDDTFESDNPPPLMPQQKTAVDRIMESVKKNRFETFLLHGVTGSGKTEVYLHVIGMLKGSGRGAIVLVPEISLTPQLLNRFRRRFGRRVAVLHSGLTDRERADEYRKIRRGDVDVVVGARSAIFAPFEAIGVIVVDEEHEGSYKQEEGLRYHARDVAIMRAKLQSAVAILGSATPSLESFYNAKNGKYHYIEISNRVDARPLPQVSIVDIKTLPKGKALSQRLIDAMASRLKRKEQIILMLNRRGFSSVLVCRECGHVPVCPCCSVSLTFHKVDRRLKCHYCDYYTIAPDVCPACSGVNLRPLGAGTQRIEEEIRAVFPDYRIARMDSDSVKGKGMYHKLINEVDDGSIDILLGTQMIAKGHDFPSVTLVGIVDADVGLTLPDFRASEKTFQLITQAAGRAGRGSIEGEVIIQTLNLGHYAIRYSLTHDYKGFYQEEMSYRAQLGYPPVRRMVKMEIRSSDDKRAAEAARAARARMQGLIKEKDTVILGPSPAPISKVRGRYRYQILLASPLRHRLRTLSIEGRDAVEEKFGKKCQVIIDVDPINLM